jgi:hypothetical protein
MLDRRGMGMLRVANVYRPGLTCGEVAELLAFEAQGLLVTKKIGII